MPEHDVLDGDECRLVARGLPFGLDHEGAPVQHERTRDVEPVARPAQRDCVDGALHDVPRIVRGAPVEAVLLAAMHTGVAGIGRHRLPTAAVAVSPGVLVELAGQRSERGERRMTEQLPPGSAIDEVEDLPAVQRVDAHQQGIALERDHARSRTTRPAIPERVVSSAAAICASG